MENTTEKASSNKTAWVIGAIVILLAVGLFTNGFGLLGRVVDGGSTALAVSDSPVLGNPNAPVTVYEFSDFSCPYCAAAAGSHDEIITAFKSRDPSWTAPGPELEKAAREGKIKYVFKYTPGHGSGKPAHLVALALQEQNLFWEFHDAAFENQADVGDIAKMKELARQLGADMTQLESSLKNNIKEYEAQLKEDISMAKSAGVRGTPTYIIDGKTFEGAISYTEMQNLIE